MFVYRHSRSTLAVDSTAPYALLNSGEIACQFSIVCGQLLCGFFSLSYFFTLVFLPFLCYFFIFICSFSFFFRVTNVYLGSVSAVLMIGRRFAEDSDYSVAYIRWIVMI